MAYFKLMSVSITLSKVLDVLAVLVVVVGGGCGGGSALPVVGISPAKIEADSAHMSTTAIASSFMVVLAPMSVQKDAKILA